MDTERPHQQTDRRLRLTCAANLEDEALDDLVACYRLLLAIARREGLLEGSGRADAGEQRAVGT